MRSTKMSIIAVRASMISLLSTCLTISGAHARNSPDLVGGIDVSGLPVLHRDVVVIGGGGSGMYTAVRLHDSNRTVAVVEAQSKLGGHAEAYTDPTNGQTFNLGVLQFENTSVVTDFFSRCDVELVPYVQPDGASEFVNFATGETVTNPPLPTQDESNAEWALYTAQWEKYPGLIRNFSLPDPVPEDLVLSLGEFIEKYELDSMGWSSFANCQGMAPVLDISMLYIFKYMTPSTAARVTAKNNNTEELYTKAGAILGAENVLLDSRVIAMDRSSEVDRVRVVVSTPNGKTQIIAKQLVSAIPPTLDNLRGFDLTPEETRVFGQFFANGYYVAILNNTGLDTSLFNIDPTRPYAVPAMPGPYLSVAQEGGLVQMWWGSAEITDEEEVKRGILDDVRRVQDANGIVTDAPADFVAFSNHSPFNLMVSNEAIEGGFYGDLFALQGQRRTFWNGAAFATQDSTALWTFTEEVILPPLLASC